MEMLERPRDFAPHHDIVFIVEGQPKCDCDDDPFRFEVYRRLHRTGHCVRIARTDDRDAAIEFLRQDMEAIEDERAAGTVVTA